MKNYRQTQMTKQQKTVTSGESNEIESIWNSYSPVKRVLNIVFRMRGGNSIAADYAKSLEFHILKSIDRFNASLNTHKNKGVIGRTYSLLVSADNQIIEELKSDIYAEPACKSGCSHCCKRMYIEISEDEASLIAARLKTFSEEKRLSISSSLHHGRRTGDPNTQCVFLEQGKCSIYDIRPLTCRTYHSTDVNECRDKEDSGKNIASNTILAFPFNDAILASFKDAISVHQSKYTYEMNSFVQRLINDEERLNSWASGQFVDEGELSVQKPLNTKKISRKQIPIRML